VWKQKKKRWQIRKKEFVINCIYHCSLLTDEKFYLRLLLIVVANSTFYENIRTIDDIAHFTFKIVCNVLDLLNDDREWIVCFTKIVTFSSSKILRDLFEMTLVLRFCCEFLCIMRTICESFLWWFKIQITKYAKHTHKKWVVEFASWLRSIFTRSSFIRYEKRVDELSNARKHLRLKLKYREFADCKWVKLQYYARITKSRWVIYSIKYESAKLLQYDCCNCWKWFAKCSFFCARSREYEQDVFILNTLSSFLIAKRNRHLCNFVRNCSFIFV
jgi:hypothetical protein